jgi:hypothetical protein
MTLERLQLLRTGRHKFAKRRPAKKAYRISHVGQELPSVVTKVMGVGEKKDGTRGRGGHRKEGKNEKECNQSEQ